jgi:hypothetical protein
MKKLKKEYMLEKLGEHYKLIYEIVKKSYCCLISLYMKRMANLRLLRTSFVELL